MVPSPLGEKVAEGRMRGNPPASESEIQEAPRAPKGERQ
jgi:hypothetical protein